MRVQKLVFVARKQLKKMSNELREKVVALRGQAPKVAIVSCDRWKKKVYDDLLVQGEFLRQGLDAKIVSWQDPAVKWKDFDVAIVGSMWGYQNDLKNFEQWLKKVEDETVLVNPVAVVRANYDKAKQFRMLKEAGVPVIETQVIKINGLRKFELPEDKFVIKPAISGSGENTFLIKDIEGFEAVRDKLRILNRTKELLVQPFVPEIRAGELGIVVIGGEIVNMVRRFPGVIEGSYKVETVARSEISDEIKELVEKITRLPAYEKAVYLRVDIVEREDGPAVMEVEAFEPQLYYYLLKGADRKKVLARMATEVASKVALQS